MFKTIFLAVVSIVGFAAAFDPIAHDIHKPMPYSFGYSIKDKHGEQHREETGDGVGHVKGSYGFTDERGIRRQVHYVADKAGFRAEVKTNEHGTAPLNPAAVKMISSAHPYLGGAGKGDAVIHAPNVAAAAVGIPAVAAAPIGIPAAAAAPIGFPAVSAKGFSSYGGQLLGGVIKGYDSRFGAY